MHRSTTTATLLVTVAFSALSGCVSVQHQPLSGPTPTPSRPSAPRPDGKAEPHVVQAPAREALELIGPPRHTRPNAPTAPRTAPAAPAPAPARQRPRHENPPPKPHRPEPRVAVPSVPRDLGKNADVCALGRKYGGWKPDSPEAVICKGAYGR
ncbi:hypothetical protein ACFVYF_12255 [Streptomyces sp. NPDC058274]|uniref:hypothetical protein n=1 Tax=Streptomyces sp. NPDC058274 TaxID=3346416 RepID=UPI0036EAD6D5